MIKKVLIYLRKRRNNYFLALFVRYRFPSNAARTPLMLIKPMPKANRRISPLRRLPSPPIFGRGVAVNARVGTDVFTGVLVAVDVGVLDGVFVGVAVFVAVGVDVEIRVAAEIDVLVWAGGGICKIL